MVSRLQDPGVSLIPCLKKHISSVILLSDLGPVAHVTVLSFPCFHLFLLYLGLFLIFGFGKLFFVFSAEDRITHRNGKDHFCLSSVAHPPSVPNHSHLVFLPPPRDCAAEVWSFLVVFSCSFWVCIFLVLFYRFETL